MAGLVDFLAGAVARAGSSQFGQGQVRLWEQVKPWVASVTTNAVRWVPRAGTKMCALPYIEEGQIVGPCEQFAVDHCIACHKPACLRHAFVDSNCDILCYGCAGQISNQTRSAPRPKDPESPVADVKTKVAWACGTLGVEETAVWSDVESAYKHLMKVHHPDTRTGNEAMFKKVREAYDFLKKVYGK